jgi:SNF2 family DNA or RNA helicase
MLRATADCGVAIIELAKWGSELQRGFTVGLYHGTRTERLAVKRNVLNGKSELLIVSYEMFRREFNDINELSWSAVMFDEGMHTTACLHCQMLHSG